MKYHKAGVPAALSCLVVVVWVGMVWSGPYKSSSHGNATTGVNRSSMNTLGFATGNCAHCHEQHASVGGTEPVPNTGTATGPDIYLGFDVEEKLCYRCHGNGGEGADTTYNIETEYGTNPHGGSGTAAITQTYLHRAGEKLSTDFSTNRHAECTDCHNPHTATAIDNADTTVGPTIGASGITPTNAAVADWVVMVVPTSYSAVAETTDRLEQYKICFKCHSDWAGFGTGTNQAKEFNDSNMGFHNIAGVANPPSSDTYGNFNIGTATVSDAGGTNWTLANRAYQMMPRYNSYTNVQLRNVTMICSDCHGSDGAPEGIHGSPRAGILKVPPGSPFTTWDNTISVNNRANCWCFNCHDPSFTNSGFSGPDGELHVNKHKKNQALCMSCHIKIPHGWNIMPRLLKPQGYGNSPIEGAVYNGSNNTSGIGQDSTCFQGSGNYTEAQADCAAGASHQVCN